MTNYFDDHKPEPGHGRRSLQGGAIVIVARAVNAVIQVGSVLLLARLLSPEDYGLVAMVTALTGFAKVFVDFGTRDAVAQRSRVTNGEVSALFWIILGIGVAFSLLVMGAAPVIARFYHEPRLTAIAVLNALSFVTMALTCQHQTLLRRVMKFNELAVIDVVSNVLSACIAVGMAFYGFGYWVLVLRPILADSFLALGVWLRCHWRPTRPTLTPGLKEMVRFGANLTGFTMADFAGRSGDRVAIGYRVGPVAVGHYQNALTIYDNLIDVLVGPLHGVAVASLSKLHSDLPELRRLWQKGLTLLTFYSMALFGILSVISPDFIPFALGEKWRESGVLLSIIALRGIANIPERTQSWLHVSAGRTDRWMRWGLLALGVQFIALAVGLPFGPKGIATAYVVCSFALFVPGIAYAGNPLNIRALDVVRATWRQLVGCLICVGVGVVLRSTIFATLPVIERIIFLIAQFGVLYFVIVAGVLRVRMPLVTLGSLLRDYIPTRFARVLPSAS